MELDLQSRECDLRERSFDDSFGDGNQVVGVLVTLLVCFGAWLWWYRSSQGVVWDRKCGLFLGFCQN
jgi:hypothetical protein